MFKTKLTIYHKSILLFLALQCSGCICTTPQTSIPTITSNVFDESWIIGKPCELPCWYGIEPGISTKDDVIQKAKTIPFLDTSTPIESKREMWDVKNEVYYSEIIEDFRCKEVSAGICATMFFRNEELTEMYIFHKNHYSFNNVVDKLGNPDGFTTMRLTPETKGCMVSLLWRKQRLRLSYSEDWFNWYSEPFRKDLCEIVKNTGNKIPNGLSVSIVEIMDNDTFEFLSEGLHPWNGFIVEK